MHVMNLDNLISITKHPFMFVESNIGVLFVCLLVFAMVQIWVHYIYTKVAIDFSRSFYFSMSAILSEGRRFQTQLWKGITKVWFYLVRWSRGTFKCKKKKSLRRTMAGRLMIGRYHICLWLRELKSNMSFQKHYVNVVVWRRNYWMCYINRLKSTTYFWTRRKSLRFKS